MYVSERGDYCTWSLYIRGWNEAVERCISYGLALALGSMAPS